MEYQFSVLAFIGRFQPFHNGHKAVVDQALKRAKKVAIVLGSHDQPRNARNPFTTAERIAMISACYPQEVRDGRIHFVPQVDHTYAIDRWIAGVETGVTAVANTPFTPDPVKLGLIGHSKDHSSFYLKCFPSWENIEADNVGSINATDIRKNIFGAEDDWSEGLPGPVFEYIDAWTFDKVDEKYNYSAPYTAISNEYDFIEDYKRQWADAPYAPTFYTADAIVVQSGHVLLVERGANPGKGLWAIPGGFVNPWETSRQAAVRELKEETKIDLSVETLDRCINSQRLFEDPHRSLRGRTVTNAFRIELRMATELPKVKGSDDAAKAQWVPIAKLRRNVMFEDHYDILQTMVPF